MSLHAHSVTQTLQIGFLPIHLGKTLWLGCLHDTGNVFIWYVSITIHAFTLQLYFSQERKSYVWLLISMFVFAMILPFSLFLQLWVERLRGSLPYNNPRHGEGHVFCRAGGEDGYSLSCWAWKNRLAFICTCMHAVVASIYYIILSNRNIEI